VDRAEVISKLLRRAAVTAPDLLAADIAAALQQAGGHHLLLYVVDYEQVTLQPVALASELMAERPKGVNIEGTMAGRAFTTQSVQVAELPAGEAGPANGPLGGSPNGWTVWAPVRERAERLGVLELGFESVDDELLRLCDDLGLLVGHLVHTAGRYTDEVERRRRRRPMNLAAEMQWDMLLPPLAFSSPDVAIAGMLEPAYFVAGDAFDYSLNGDVLDFTIFDAMGHGVHSTLASALALGASRYGRRRGLELTVMAEQIDDALVEQFDGQNFVTGQLAQLDVATGILRLLNAGHPLPMLIRGTRVVGEIVCDPCLPLGLGIDSPTVEEVQLTPGDRILFYSDGAVEARPVGGEQFGVDRLRSHLEEYLDVGNLPAEVLRKLAGNLRGHRGGELADDVTLVLLEWQPGR